MASRGAVHVETECWNCGYDVRGMRGPGARCPECGADAEIPDADRRCARFVARGCRAMWFGVGISLASCFGAGIALAASGSVHILWCVIWPATPLVLSVAASLCCLRADAHLRPFLAVAFGRAMPFAIVPIAASLALSPVIGLQILPLTAFASICGACVFLDEWGSFVRAPEYGFVGRTGGAGWAMFVASLLSGFAPIGCIAIPILFFR